MIKLSYIQIKLVKIIFVFLYILSHKQVKISGTSGISRIEFDVFDNDIIFLLFIFYIATYRGLIVIYYSPRFIANNEKPVAGKIVNRKRREKN